MNQFEDPNDIILSSLQTVADNMNIQDCTVLSMFRVCQSMIIFNRLYCCCAVHLITSVCRWFRFVDGLVWICHVQCIKINFIIRSSPCPLQLLKRCCTFVRADSTTVPIGHVNMTLKQTGRLGVTGKHQAGDEPKRQTLEVTTGTN